MRRVVLLTAALALAGCSVVQPLAQRAAAVEDDAHTGAKFVICRGISVGAWVRAYGSDPQRAAAWRTLCNDSTTETPAK